MASHNPKAARAELHERQAQAIAREAQDLTDWARRLLAPLRRCGLADGPSVPWPAPDDGDPARDARLPPGVGADRPADRGGRAARP